MTLVADVSWKRHRDVALALSLGRLREERDLTVRGLLRWAIEPASYTAVYLLLFGVFLQRDRFAYPLFLLLALIVFRYLSGVWLASMSIVVGHTALLQNHVFPRIVLPVIPVLTETANLAVAFVLVVPLLAWYGLLPGIQIVVIPLIIVGIWLLASGPALLLSIVGVRWQASRAVVGNLVRISLFTSSALVGVDEVDVGWQRAALRANPMTGIFESLRAVLINRAWPAGIDLLYPIAAGLILVALGLVVFRRHEQQLARLV